MANGNTAPIESTILVVRNRRVMLASDLAKIYGVETRVLNQAVKRNRDRFPEDFTFRLTGRGCGFKITICDLETRREYQVSALCFYRTRRDHGC